MKKILTILLALTLVLSLVACSNNKDTKINEENSSANETNKVKIGLVGSDSVVWQHVAKVVKDKGVDLEIVYFDSYPLPNKALDSGDIDLNAFQHHIYLDKEVEQFGYKIEAVADTSFAPLGIYSETIKNLDELEDGQTVAIPDDVTNGGRALKLLEAAGLIKVDENAGVLPTVADVKENPKNLKLLEISASNIPATLAENQIAVINSGIAVDAGYKPGEDTVFLEEAVKGENPYINLIAVRSEDKDKEWLKIILDAYFTPETKAIIEEDSKGTSYPVW